MPLALLFGGQGIASNRANSISLASKKLSKQNKIYVGNQNINHSGFETLTSNLGSNNPFAAFTNSACEISAYNGVQKENVISFLQDNDLIQSNLMKTSSLSGNTKANNKKSLTHVFNLISLAPNQATTNTEQCVASVASQNKSFIARQSNFTSPGTTICVSYSMTISGATGTKCNFYSTTPGFSSSLTSCSLKNAAGTANVSITFNLTGCQQMHKKCAGHTQNLPVELEKFEVE